MSQTIEGDPPPPPLTAVEYVPITLQVHVDDLTSFYEAVAAWSKRVDPDGGRGRMRVA